MKHGMVDIETVSAEPAGAGITAVAMVVFDPMRMGLDGGGDEMVWYLDPAWTPGRRDKSTYEFWMKQDARVRAPVFGGVMLPWDFCEAFTEFVSLQACESYWAYPTRFDFGHLRELYHQQGHKFPFEFYKELDLTTLRWSARQKAKIQDIRLSRDGKFSDVTVSEWLEGEMKRIKEQNSAAHDPLADARAQALLCQQLYQYVTGLGA